MEKIVVITIDRKWNIFQLFTRDFNTRLWKPELIADKTNNISISLEIQTTTYPEYTSTLSTIISQSFVTVRFSTPYQLSGISESSYVGTGNSYS